MPHPPGTHLTGPDRDHARTQAAHLYARGCTIRSVATQLGCSYSLARTLLVEAGVPLRGRGGHLPAPGQ